MPALFSFRVKWTNRCTAQSSVHWEGLFSPLSSWAIPERSCRAATVHLEVVLAYSEEPSIKQVSGVFSSVNRSYIKNHEVIGTGQEREGSVAGVGIMDIWVTSSCNLLVPSGLRPNHVHITSIWWWSFAANAYLCSFTSQVMLSS